MSDPRQQRIVDITSQLVSIPTHQREAEAQDLLRSLLETIGFTCRLTEVEPGRPNLIARRGDGGVFFCSHVDCHPPHAHPDPFACRLDAGVLTGRGVLDAKGQIAALLVALQDEPHAPATVAITCDEERGGTGSEQLDVPDGPWMTTGGVVLEPTDLAVCTAQMGQIDVELTAGATPGHIYAGSVEPSASDLLLDAIAALGELPFLGLTHPTLGTARLQVPVLQAGDHPWRRAASGRAAVTLGLLPGVDAVEAERNVRQILDGRIDYHLWDASPGIELPSDLPVAAVLRGMGLPEAGMPSWTDAANLLHHHGLGCVVFGAGRLRSAHSDLETVAVADLVRLSEVLSAVALQAGRHRT